MSEIRHLLLHVCPTRPDPTTRMGVPEDEVLDMRLCAKYLEKLDSSYLEVLLWLARLIRELDDSAIISKQPYRFPRPITEHDGLELIMHSALRW